MRTRQHAASSGNFLKLAVLAIFAVAVLCAGRATAADAAAQPKWFHVIILKVKTDRVADFEALAKEMNAANKAAKMTQGQVYEVVAGEGPVYHVAIPMMSMSENDSQKPPMEPAAMASWTQRISGVVESARDIYVQPVASTEATNQATPSLIFLRSITVNQGKQEAFTNWIKNDLMAALKKANLSTDAVHGSFGDSPDNFYFLLPIANWAEFDKPNPLNQALGEKGMQALTSKLEGVIKEQTFTLLRPRPDLSAP